MTHILCQTGLHEWQAPRREEMDILRKAGPDVVFWTWSAQVATQRCGRVGCTAQRSVYREGWHGQGVPEPRWKPASQQRVERIKALPNVYA